MINLNISNRHWIHIALSLVVLTFFISIFSILNQQPLPEKSYAIDSTKSIFSDSETVPPDQNHWKDTPLPDDWSRSAEGSYKWYRFELPVSALTSPFAIYLTYTTRPASVFINNHLQFKTEVSSARTARTWGQHRFVRLHNIEPDKLLHNQSPKKLTVNIMLATNQSNSGMLGDIFIGPENNLFEAFNEAFFIKVTLVKLLVFAMVLSSLFVVMLWIFRRNETIYAFYAIAVFLWAIYSFSHIPLQLPFSSHAWEWLRCSAMVFWSISISFFCNRFLNSPQPKIEKLLVLHATLISFILIFIDENSLYWLGDFFFPAYATVLGLYPSYRMLSATFKRKSPYLTWLTMCGMMVMLLAAHDITVMAHWMEPWKGLYLHYSALVLLSVFNLILIKRFVSTLNEVEALNTSLEQRVEKKTQELKANYEQLHHMQREKDLNFERERIMQDMHDGIGGSLVSMRAALEGGNWKEQDICDGLGNALDDLYLMIHSLDPYDADLSLALGSIRRTLENRLRRADINLQWVIQDMPPIQGLSPAIVLSIMRIMQEAIANIIKHSNASEVIIRIPDNLPDIKGIPDPTVVILSITDNGCGFNPANFHHHANISHHNGKAHYGLSGMQSRANKAGIQLSIQSENSGTRVQLIIPILLG